MALGPRLELRHSTSLVMTPQLRQAIQLLQYSNLELSAFVAEELERNPLLERDERPETVLEEGPRLDQQPSASAAALDTADLTRAETLPDSASAPLDAEHAEDYDPGGAADGGPWTPSALGAGGRADFADDDRGLEETLAAPRSLAEHLGEQLRLEIADPAERLIGAHLIALLDGAGRLTAAPEAVAAALGTTYERVEAVRARMQRFDPVGLFCRDLRECLAVQLAERNRLDPAMAALLDNLPLLARRDMRGLMAVCGVDGEDLRDMIAELRRLDPKPGAGFEAAAPQSRIADILMRPAPGGAWRLELNPQTLPRVLVNQDFHVRVGPRASREDRAFLAENLAAANWLVRSLQQRAQTILKVAAEIVSRQEAFFRQGVGHLRPLTLRDVAGEVALHESTVSRVTANKSIATPRGIFELKYFFTTAITGTSGETHSAESVRQRIRALVAAEEGDAVLSDDAIVVALRQEGVDIARRTVAKYREALGIPGSVQRRREKAVLV